MKIKVKDLELCILINIFFVYTMFPNIIVGSILLIDVSLYIILNIKNIERILALLFFILLFQLSIKDYCSAQSLKRAIDYIDEFVVLIFLIYLIYQFANGKVKIYNFEKIILVGIIGFLAIGTISSYYYGYQSFFACLVDILTCSKFIIYYFTTRIIIDKHNVKDFLYNNLNVPIKWMSICIFVLSIINITTGLFYKRYYFRYFMEPIQLFMPHPVYLEILCITLISILLKNLNRDIKNFKFIILLSIVAVFTLRVKAIVSVTLILFIYFATVKLKIKSIVLIGVIVIFGGLSMASSQIEFYYSNDDTIRERMTSDAIELAKQAFPIGNGFGTFGSSVAFQFESPLYYKLGYFTLNTKEEAMGDTFWPIVIAQTGFIGTIFFLISIIGFVYYSYKNLKSDSGIWISTISIMLYVIISSTASTAFFNPAIAPMFMLMGFIVSEQDKKNWRKDEKDKLKSELSI